MDKGCNCEPPFSLALAAWASVLRDTKSFERVIGDFFHHQANCFYRLFKL